MGAGTRALELGALADAPGCQRSAVRAPRSAQPPVGAGMRVREMPHQASGFVWVFRPAAAPGLPSLGVEAK